jgi:hypothetical protein
MCSVRTPPHRYDVHHDQNVVGVHSLALLRALCLYMVHEEANLPVCRVGRLERKRVREKSSASADAQCRRAGPGRRSLVPLA